MIINHNMNALNAHRSMVGNTGAAGKSMEKLSSGLRINRAGDDAAGLAISEKMRGQIRGLDQASRNAQDGISLIQTAEGALNETHSILQRMRELAVQGSNDTNNDSDREQIEKEMDQLKSEIDRIATTTEFNTKKLLDGSLGCNVVSDVDKTTAIKVAGVADIQNVGLSAGIDGAERTYKIAAAGSILNITDGATIVGSVDITDYKAGNDITFKDKDGKALLTIKTNTALADAKTAVGDVVVSGDSINLQIGANEGQNTKLSITDMGAKSLTVEDIDVSDAGKADKAVTTIQSAIDKVSSERSKLGAMQNRLEHTINNLGTASENLTAAESRVRDVDMAKEMMTFSKNNILQQAAQAMLAQANQQPQGVLQLLR